MDNFETSNIDYDALRQEIENAFVLKFIKMAFPDSADKDFVLKVIDIFIKHGVPVMTAIDIFAEMIALRPKKGDSDDRSKGNT